MGLKPEHHCFVQKLLTCGYLSDQGARALYAELAQQTHDRHFDNFYSAINVELRSLDLKLSRVKYPHDKQVYMGIVNTLEDESAKLATTLNAQQVAYFRALLEKLATDDDVAVQGLDSMQALNLTLTQTQPTQSSGKPLSRADREATLLTLCGDGWLAHDAATGVYHIGVRTFLELTNYLEASGPSDTVKEFWQLS